MPRSFSWYISKAAAAEEYLRSGWSCPRRSVSVAVSVDVV
jgi:hypothetical protein